MIYVSGLRTQAKGRPMIYISYGVPKSASTFAYVVTEQVLRTAGFAPAALSDAVKGRRSRLNYIDPITWDAIESVQAELGEKSAVIKTHGAPDQALLDAIERCAVFAGAIVRDPRDIALSLLDHARRSRAQGGGDFAALETVEDTFPILDEQFDRLRQWMRCGQVLLLTYDEIAFNTAAAVRRIAAQLGLSVAPADIVAALLARGKIAQFNKGIRARHEQEMPAATQQVLLDRYAEIYRRFLGAPDATPTTAPAAAPAPTAAAAGRLRWFHSIDLGNGVITQGQKPLETIAGNADLVFKDGVAGKTVLDIGAWDGAFSFEAERRGAARVLATDHFCWVGAGWGKQASFDFARTALASRVEARVIDVSDISVETVGQFDVVLLLGVLYHLLHPLLILERIAPVARELLVVETETALDDEDRPAMVFFPGAELNNDPTNWWAPNIRCMDAMLRHVGCTRIEVSPSWGHDGRITHRRGRFTFHAWK